MDNIILSPTFLEGELTPPPSKSVAHRALIASALAEGTTKFTNLEFSNDITATLNALKKLGTQFNIDTISSHGFIRNHKLEIDAHESGSTLRFLIPIVIACENICTFYGSGRLPSRPLDTFFDVFKKENISFNTPVNSYLPLEVSGKFTSEEVEVLGNVSSQFITGLIFAGVINKALKRIKVVGKFESKPYVDLTVDVLRSFGFKVYEDNNIYYIGESTGICPSSYTIESDFSQAAFYLCGGVINGNITLKNINLNSKQGDKEIIEIIKQFGGNIRVKDDAINVSKSDLKGIDIDATDIPDLVPILATLGCYAKGKTKIYGAKRVRLKECDRLLAMETELSKMGAKITSGEDYLEIYHSKLHGGTVYGHNDHRIVMALAIAAIGASEKTIINDYKAINKSYSNFFDDYFKLGGKKG